MFTTPELTPETLEKINNKIESIKGKTIISNTWFKELRSLVIEDFKLPFTTETTINHAVAITNLSKYIVSSGIHVLSSSILHWSSYKRLENEFVQLTQSVSLSERNLQTFSPIISDLILRTVSECENVLRSIKGVENLTFRQLLSSVNSKIQIDLNIINIIYEEGFINNKIIHPFNKTTRVFDPRNPKYRIPKWYYTYNLLKHDKAQNIESATLEILLHALAALFIINFYLKFKGEFELVNFSYNDYRDYFIKNYSKVFEPTELILCYFYPKTEENVQYKIKHILPKKIDIPPSTEEVDKKISTRFGRFFI